MKIKSIDLVRVERPDGPSLRARSQAGSTLSASTAPAQQSQPHRKAWPTEIEVANPMSRFPRFKPRRQLYAAQQWPGFVVKVTAEDGTWGLGTAAGRPTAAVIEDAFTHILIGEDCLAIDKLWDMMFSRLQILRHRRHRHRRHQRRGFWRCGIWLASCNKSPCTNSSAARLASGIFTYATGDDVDWYRELGFRAFKLPCQYGPADGLWGLDQNERRIAEVRALIGDDCELMLDCYMAFDVEYSVRLAERLRPYKFALAGGVA